MGTRRVFEDALIATIAAGLMLAVPAAAEDPPVPSVNRADLEAAIAAPWDDAAFDTLLAGLPQVSFDDNGTRRNLYVWEGDLLLDRENVRASLYAAKQKAAPARGASELLVQVRDDGLAGYWPRPSRALTYAVDCTGLMADQCTVLQSAMTTATADWVKACGKCGLSFRRVDAPPGIKPSDAAAPLFIVRYQPDQLGYIALAFFANDPAFKRYVSVTPSYFVTSFDRAGVLRHEIGHVLGYRHEHNRAPSGCLFEDSKWQPLTDYDPKSVMHYFCGGGGTKAMQLTATDIAGHRQLYKLP
jgi:hypothetical protein